MTYTFKLARRIARLRNSTPMLPLLLFAVACAAGEPTSVTTGSTDGADPDAIAVAPRRVTLESNQSVLFKAYADATPGSAEVTSIEWTADGGNLSADGSYSSASTGVFRVAGKRRGKPHAKGDTATVIIVPSQPSLADVVISPATPTVGAGLRLQFSVMGKLSDGSEVPIGATWSTTTGTIDAGGLLTAGLTPGTFQVIAKAASSDVADTVDVNVLAVQSVQISPTSSSLASSAQQLYTTWTTLSDGRNFPGNGVAFTATGGSITSTGLYTAPTTGGNYTITAKVVGGTASATASVAVVAPTTSASSGTYPNKPSGLATLVETNFSALPTSSGWTSSTMTSGSITQQTTSNAVVASDAGAPVSPAGLFRTILPSGLADGVSPVTTKFWQYTGSTNDFTEIYVSFWLRVTGNGSTFENQSVGQKLFYFAEGSTTRENHSPLFLDGNYASVSAAPNGTKMTSAPLSWYIYEMRDDGSDGGGGSVHHGANVNSSAAVLQVGKWYQIEVYGKINTHNSDPAPHDGIARIWVNGVLTHDYSPTRGNGIRWASARNPYGFYMLSWVPVWGGDVGQVKDQTDYLDLDHLYVAVR